MDTKLYGADIIRLVDICVGRFSYTYNYRYGIGNEQFECCKTKSCGGFEI